MNKEFLSTLCDSIKEKINTRKEDNWRELFSSAQQELTKAHEVFQRKFKELKANVESMLAVTKIEVPYNRDTERLSFAVDGNTLTITIRNDDGTATTRQTNVLPSSVCMESIKHHYDKELGAMVFTFKNNFNATSDEDVIVFKEGESIASDAIEEISDMCPQEIPSDVADDYVAEENTETTSASEASREDLIQSALALRNCGWSYRRIGKELGFSDKTVARWIKDATEN